MRCAAKRQRAATKIILILLLKTLPVQLPKHIQKPNRRRLSRYRLRLPKSAQVYSQKSKDGLVKNLVPERKRQESHQRAPLIGRAIRRSKTSLQERLTRQDGRSSWGI